MENNSELMNRFIKKKELVYAKVTLEERNNSPGKNSYQHRRELPLCYTAHTKNHNLKVLI